MTALTDTERVALFMDAFELDLTEAYRLCGVDPATLDYDDDNDAQPAPIVRQTAAPRGFTVLGLEFLGTTAR